MSFGSWFDKIKRKEAINNAFSDEIMKLNRVPKSVPKEESIRRNYSIYRAGHDNGYNLALSDVVRLLQELN